VAIGSKKPVLKWCDICNLNEVTRMKVKVSLVRYHANPAANGLAGFGFGAPRGDYFVADGLLFVINAAKPI
jgi:hypothetical protein